MFNPNFIRRAASLVVGALSLAALLGFMLWPEWVQERFHSRDALAGFSLWAGVVSFFLHPVSKQVIDGLRRFHRFCKEIDRNIDPWS